jgi:hypothetical protein
LAEDLFGMRGKSKDERREVVFLRSADEETQDFLMSEMEAVEVSNGHHYGATKRWPMVKPFEDVHVFRVW